MSKKKKRKVSRNSDLEVGSALQEFREDLIELVPKVSQHKFSWNLAFKKYQYAYWRTQRKKVSSDEIPKEKGSRNPDKDILEKWGEGINPYSYKNKIESMTTSEKVEEVLTYGPPLSHQKTFLKALINCVKYNNLLKFYKSQNPGRNKPLSKHHCLEELISMFFGEDTNIQKRENEQENIDALLEDEDYRFLTLCDIQIPRDVLHHILSFHEYNLELLIDVGKLCKTIYITILSSWKKLVVKKKHIHEISVLVLQSCESITFKEKKLEAKYAFRIDEILHILNQLNAKKLRKITFETSLSTQLKTLRRLYQKRKKLPPSLSHVRTLRLKSWVRTKQSYEQGLKNSKLLMKEIFPRLERVENPLKFRFYEDMSIRAILLDLHTIDNVMGRLKGEGQKFDEEKSGFFGTKNGGIWPNKNGLNSLKIIFEDHPVSSVVKFINSLTDLEDLEVQCYGIPDENNLNLSDITNTNIRSLKIHNGCYPGNLKKYFTLDALSSPDLYFGNLTKLKIQPSCSLNGAVDHDEFIGFLKMKNLTELECGLRIPLNSSEERGFSEKKSILFDCIKANWYRFQNLRISFLWVGDQKLMKHESWGCRLTFQSTLKTFWNVKKFRLCSLNLDQHSESALSSKDGIFHHLFPTIISSQILSEDGIPSRFSYHDFSLSYIYAKKGSKKRGWVKGKVIRELDDLHLEEISSSGGVLFKELIKKKIGIIFLKENEELFEEYLKFEFCT